MTTAGDAGGDDDDAAGQPDAGPPAPTLTSINPSSGIVTTQVTLTGTDFGDAEGTVDVGGQQAAIASWSDTQIVAVIPDLLPGDRDVIVSTTDGSSNPQTFRVILPPMVYLNNDANDTTMGNLSTVTALSFDPATGALTQLGAPVTMNQTASGYGGCSGAALLHEGTRRLFASGNQGVTVYDIDPITGELSMVGGSPFATGSTFAEGMQVNAAGTRLFVASYNGGPGTVAVFDIAVTGALTPIAGSPFASGTSLDHALLSRNEQFLYVNAEDSTFSAFSIAASGALTPVAGSPFTHGAFSYGIAGRPGHDQLVIPDNTPRLNIFNLDPTTGVPSHISGSPFATSAGMHFPAYTPDGNRLYVSSQGPTLNGYSVDASGAPTRLAGSPWTFAGSLSCLSFSRDGGYLLANIEGAKQVAVFIVGVDGVPVHVSGSPFTQTTTTESASGMAITF